MSGTWSQALWKPWSHNTTPSLFRYPAKEETPPAEPITLSAKVNFEHTPPGPAETLMGRDATVLLTESDVEIQKDPPTSQAISPIEVETQVVPATRSVDTVTASVGRMAFKNPKWWWSSQDPLKGGRWLATRMPLYRYWEERIWWETAHRRHH